MKWNKAAEGAKERPRVFCASLADVFEDWNGLMADSRGDTLFTVNGKWTDSADPDESPTTTMHDVRRRLFKLIAATPNLDWLLLTKRPENVLKLTRKAIDPCDNPDGNEAGEPNGLDVATFGELYPNVWLGTSCENQKAAEFRHPHLMAAKAKTTFWSAEPLLGPIDAPLLWKKYGKPSWVIIGGESGSGARPMHIEWARSLVRQCKDAGVPCFVKQLGSEAEGDYYEDRDHFENAGYDWPSPRGWNKHDGQPMIGSRVALPLLDKKGGNIKEWAPDLRIREFPEVKS